MKTGLVWEVRVYPSNVHDDVAYFAPHTGSDLSSIQLAAVRTAQTELRKHCRAKSLSTGTIDLLLDEATQRQSAGCTTNAMLNMILADAAKLVDGPVVEIVVLAEDEVAKPTIVQNPRHVWVSMDAVDFAKAASENLGRTRYGLIHDHSELSAGDRLLLWCNDFRMTMLAFCNGARQTTLGELWHAELRNLGNIHGFADAAPTTAVTFVAFTVENPETTKTPPQLSLGGL